MRTKLSHFDKTKRYRFTATVGGVGFKNPYKDYYQPTMVLVNVNYQNKLVTDHLWIAYGKQLTDLGMLQHSDQITFTGRVQPYYKGYYLQQSLDYKIANPRQLTLLKTSNTIFRPQMPTVPKEKNALIGYIMTINRDFYLKTGRPYEKFYVKKYNRWKKQHHQN